MNKKILIIGGCGYIGSALYSHLKDSYAAIDGSVRKLLKYTIDTVDLEWFGNFINPDNFVMDYRNLTKEQLSKYDAIILLAAYSSPTLCDNSGRTSVIHNNVNNFADILPKLREGQKFIYASSITVYQGMKSNHIFEDQPLVHRANTNLYDFSKQDCDRIIQMYPEVEFYGLRLATLSGISSNWRSDIMVNAMTDCGIMQSEIKLFNPTNHKAILYMGDLVRAIECIINNPVDKRGFYNLASYNGIIEEIAETVASITNSKLKILNSSQMGSMGLPSTVYDIAVSTHKFEKEFDFKFDGTIAAITEEIILKRADLHSTKRITGIKYV